MNILIYLGILVLKIIEVSIGTTRIVLITRGERFMGACLGFVEVIIWVILVSTVVNDIASDPIKVLVYAAGFALGNYAGSLLEEKLGIGNIRVEAIVMEEHGLELAEIIRTNGYAVTVVQGNGMNYKRHILLMNIKRKNYQKVLKIIKDTQKNVVITINDIKPIYGGHGVLKR